MCSPHLSKHLSYCVVNAWQRKSVLFTLKESGDTVTHPPCLTIIMAAEATALHRDQIPPSPSYTCITNFAPFWLITCLILHS